MPAKLMFSLQEFVKPGNQKINLLCLQDFMPARLMFILQDLVSPGNQNIKFFCLPHFTPARLMFSLQDFVKPGTQVSKPAYWITNYFLQCKKLYV